MSTSLSSIRVVPAAGPHATGIGKYRYIAMLAEGGMATVYLAVTKGQANFEKLVVIKELHSSLAEDPSFVAMFMDEARLAARLNHPNVVATYEVGSDGGRHFIAMEFLEGVPYTKLLRSRDRIPPPLAIQVRVLCDVLYGLHHAHDLRDFDGKPLSVVHRDVSPQNVLLTFDGGVKVLDFGIAKAALTAEQRPDDFKGKLEYMAPEQALLDEVDRRADLYCVGIMLWEAIARGRRFYERGEDKYARLVSGEPPDLLAARPDAPKRLVEVVRRALQRDPAKRFATAQEMVEELEDWLDGTTQHVRARDIGGYVLEKFGERRARLAEAVQAQLEVVRKLPHEEAPLQLSRIGVNDTVPPPGAGLSSSLSPPPPSVLAAVAATPPALPPVVMPPRRGGAGALALVALGVGLGLVVGLGGFFAYRRGAKTASAAPPVVAVAPPAAPTATPEIDFTIRATPPTATISVDGVALGGNPTSGKRPRDGAIHVVHVEAPGYEPREESITFDRSLLVALDLHPLPPPEPTSKKVRPRR